MEKGGGIEKPKKYKRKLGEKPEEEKPWGEKQKGKKYRKKVIKIYKNKTYFYITIIT